MKKTRAKKDTCALQTTGMAGELLVAGKLFKRGLQVSLTYGNAKSMDLFAHNQATNSTYKVEVKTLRSKNCFLLNPQNLIHDYVYVFVLLNAFAEQEEFFILRGEELIKDLPKFFGPNISPKTRMPAVNYGPLEPYRENWAIFDD